MTNWLLSRSRLNNDDANVRTTTRVMAVNGIFNDTEAADAADH